jgi:hypothetical protein
MPSVDAEQAGQCAGIPNGQQGSKNWSRLSRYCLALCFPISSGVVIHQITPAGSLLAA